MKKVKIFKIKSLLYIVAILIIGILIGRWTSGGESHHHQDVSVSENTVWTCSMHPQIRQDHPGTCPLCGMDLIPADDAEEESDLPLDALRMSPTAMQLAQVHTQTVSKGEAVKEIRLSGKVALDPTQSFSQNAHVSGRIEDFYFNSMGDYIKEGSKIGLLYSPELLSTQKELLLAYQNRENAPGIFEAVKEKLRLWKISDNQINEIIQQGNPTEYFPIYANRSGYLVKKNVEKGDYVSAGESLFLISNLSSLWGIFDVYEKDATFVKNGIEIQYSLPSMPGKTFNSKIDFVEPILNPDTRTLTARIKINNSHLGFKPEMLINGVLHTTLDSNSDQIIVPKSAVMWTGKNSVVYVKYETDKHVGFQMRPVVLGPVVGDGYIIEEGLKEGEEIVVQGTFSVDAAAQLANKPSMMNFDQPVEKIAFVPHELDNNQKQKINAIFKIYFDLKDHLVNDNFETAKSHYLKLIDEWQKTDWKVLPKEVQIPFENLKEQDFLSKNKIDKTHSIEKLRNPLFYDLSNVMIQIIETYTPFEKTVYIQHCPMANKDKGADWLSLEKEIKNPYYGASMLTCGEVTGTK